MSELVNEVENCREEVYASKLSASERQSSSNKGCINFFGILKRETENLKEKHSSTEVRQPVFMFIEIHYNRIRSHSALGYVAPNEYNLRKAA